MYRSNIRPWLAAIAIFTIAAVSLTRTGVAAAGPGDTMPGIQQVITAAQDGDANVRIPAWFETASAPAGRAGLVASAAVATSTFQVTYHGFSPQAQAAFQKALDIWGTIVVSPVPITVDATWTPLGTNILGQAGATNYRRWSSSPPAGAQTNVWYPMALANSLAGSDLDAANPDISASFNSAFTAWSFDTNGMPVSGKYDFTSVVLHEVGHGLGFISTLSKSGSTGSWGGGTSYPLTFDRFVYNGANQQLITFATGSTSLGSQLTSNSVYFNGTNANAANGGSKPQLYAPATWSGGSSISHLDETAFPRTTDNALMTPALSSAEVHLDPGAVGKGVFKDIGWVLSGGSGGGGGGGGTNPVPVVSSISPSAVTAGGATFTVTVNGLNFVAGSLVTIDGVTRGTSFVSSTLVTAVIHSSDITVAGSRAIGVTSPAPVGGPSNTVSLTVTPRVVSNPVPVITSLSRTSVSAGSAGFTLTITGSGFVPSSKVRFDGTARTTTYVSPTQVKTSVSAYETLFSRTYSVTVQNPAPGGGVSNARSLSVRGGFFFAAIANSQPALSFFPFTGQ